MGHVTHQAEPSTQLVRPGDSNPNRPGCLWAFREVRLNPWSPFSAMAFGHSWFGPAQQRSITAVTTVAAEGREAPTGAPVLVMAPVL